MSDERPEWADDQSDEAPSEPVPSETGVPADSGAPPPEAVVPSDAEREPAVEQQEAEERPNPLPPTITTVEALVRRQLSESLGGPRGMLEAALPTLLFTAIWLTTKELQWALVISLTGAAALLVIRLVQRGTTQFVLNALFGIAIGWLFVWMAARGGGSENEQALAFFLPGIIWSSVYSVGLAASCLTRWPLVGFMLGSVTGDPLAWHQNPQVVTLCVRLTWLLGAPGIVGVLLQGPVWLGGWSGAIGASTAVLVLSALRFGLGWPLRIGAFAAMTWLLARNKTPLRREDAAEA